MINKMEFRFKPVDLQYDDDKMVVSGYVNLTEQFSNVMATRHSRHGFIEKISKGAFERALARGNDVDFLAEHDPNLILSSTRNKSLSLQEDDKGLFMSAIISPTSWGKDYYTLVKDGILKNFSFGFRTLEDKWEDRADGLLERTIEDLELFEVSVVRNPAYPQSNIQARNLDIVSEEELEERAKGVKEMETVKHEEVEVREEEEPIVEEEGEEKEEEQDLETLFQSLERTVLALELKIDKLYKMVEEQFKEPEEEEEVEEEEVVEEEPTEDVDEDIVEEEEKEEDRSEVVAEVEISESSDNAEETRDVNDKIEENKEILNNSIADLKARINDLK